MCGRGCSRAPGATPLLVVSLALLFAASVDCAAIQKRAVGGGGTASGEMGIVKVCHSSTPCGWAVYLPFNRRVDYFVQNTCECAKDKKCLRAEDDLSVSAYIYRCRTDDEASHPSP